MPWFCPWATPCFECILQGAHSRDARADCFLWQEWLNFWICETAFLQTWQDMAFHSQHLAKGGEAFRASQDHSVYVQPPWIFFAGNCARSPEAKSSAKPPEPAQPPRTAYLLVLVSFFLWNALDAVTGHQQLHLRLLFNKAVPGVRCDYCWNNTAQSEKHLLLVGGASVILGKSILCKVPWLQVLKKLMKLGEAGPRMAKMMLSRMTPPT